MRSEAQDLARLLEGPEDSIDLGRAALLLARVEYPDLDLDAEIARLGALADAVKLRVQAQPGIPGRLAVLRSFLADDCDFCGNEQDYYDPRNSFLNDVLERRTGIPITLSIVYMEVGRRVGVPLFGVGLPGHFLVKYEDPLHVVLLDPFHGGRGLTPAAARQILEGMNPGGADFRPEFLAAVDKRYIVLRMLNNLRAIYLERREFRKALGMLDLILALSPASGDDLKQRGLLHCELEHYREARQDLENYLFLRPDGPDALEVRARLSELKRFSAMLN